MVYTLHKLTLDLILEVDILLAMQSYITICENLTKQSNSLLDFGDTQLLWHDFMQSTFPYPGLLRFNSHLF